MKRARKGVGGRRRIYWACVVTVLCDCISKALFGLRALHLFSNRAKPKHSKRKTQRIETETKADRR